MMHRRDFIKTSGMLIASVSALPLDAFSFQTSGPYPDPDFRQLDSWIVIRPDNTATFFVGKTDLGQGTGTAFRQIMCDELDIAFENTTCVMGRTDVTVDQGGSGGSDALQTDGYPMRCRPTATRCVASPLKRAACCWRWPRNSSAFP